MITRWISVRCSQGPRGSCSLQRGGGGRGGRCVRAQHRHREIVTDILENEVREWTDLNVLVVTIKVVVQVRAFDE